MKNRFSIRHSKFEILNSTLSSRNHNLLQRLPILPRSQSDGRPGRARPHARGAAADLAAQIALHRHGLLDLLLRLAEQRGHPGEEVALRLFVHHEDVVVGAVALAVAAADAVALDEDLAARVAL